MGPWYSCVVNLLSHSRAIMYAGHENAQAIIPHVVFATLVEHVRPGLLLLILDNKLTRYVLGGVDVLNRNCRVGF